MRKIVFAGLSAALFAIPAAASAQAYVQLETGVESVSVDGESDEGISYGVSAGYDMPIAGDLFVGVQGTVADSNTKECERDVFDFGDRVCVKTGRDLAAVVRLGTAIGPQSKLYVLGGYTNARIVATYRDAEGRLKDGVNGDGFRLGAGYEYDLSDRLFVKAEYRYSNYEADFSRHNGVIALGARF